MSCGVERWMNTRHGQDSMSLVESGRSLKYAIVDMESVLSEQSSVCSAAETAGLVAMCAECSSQATRNRAVREAKEY